MIQFKLIDVSKYWVILCYFIIHRFFLFIEIIGCNFCQFPPVLSKYKCFLKEIKSQHAQL